MEIGPHVFHDTAFFEVLYHSASTEYSSSQDKSSMCFEHSFSEASSTSSLSCQPLFSAGSPEASVEVTPALISQVNQAAAANPAIQNLLQLAAFGRASHDQLKTLGIFVQSLAMPPSSYASANFTPSHSVLSDTLLQHSNAGASYRVFSKDGNFISTYVLQF